MTNDVIMYRREACKINKICEDFHNGEDYYELIPYSDESLKIVVPINSPFLTPLMTKEKLEELIMNMPNIPIITSDTRLIEQEYKDCFARGTYEDLIKIIKTTYLRNRERLEHHKRVGDKDYYYFLKAETLLYQEMALVLNMSIDEVREYIISRIGNLS